jgi:hypothetical protein
VTHPTHTSGRYDEIAASAVDKVDEFGECRIFRVADTEGLRRAIRREARRRKVKIVTMGWESDSAVIAATNTPSLPAQAYGHVTFEHMASGGDVDISVRYIDANEPDL